MLKYYNHYIKKKKFYYSLILYFVFLNYNILLYYREINNIKLLNLIYLDIKYLKLHSSNILSLFIYNKLSNNICMF